MNNRGFTLIELVVALVISAFLAGVIFQLLNGQQRFVGMQSAREEVQQNGRATLELISAELRGASPAAIVEADSVAIEFGVPRIWGMVCGGGGGTWTVVFPGSDLAAFKSANETDRLAVRDSTTAAALRWRFTSVTEATPASGSGAASCPALGPEAGRVQVRTLTVNPDTIPVQIGERAYLYDVIRYDVGTSNVPGNWVRRTDAGTAQPLAGPLGEDDAGPIFRLRYFDASGNELTAPVAAPSSIAQVQIRVTTVSSSSNPQQEFSDSTRVRLRN